MSTISSLGSTASSLSNLLSGSSTTSGSTTAPTTNSFQPITVNGLVSGLDTTSIIKGLVAVQQQQIDELSTKEKSVQSVQAEYKAIQAKLATLQGTLQTLAKTNNGAFDGRTATSSDTNLATVAASSSATAGVYSLTVNSLAKANIVASQGYDSANDAIAQGTFGIQNGTGAVTTITIDSSNATLQGLANAINGSAAGVTAAVVNDGSSAHGYRLVLTAKTAGAANAIAITNNLTDTSGGAVKPVFDQSYVGQADLGTGFTGTSAVAGNTGAGGYTGTSNNAYTFSVTSGGTVGTDSITLHYTDATGTNTGDITVDPSDVGQLKTVAQGLQVQFGAGTLVAGQSFSIKTYVPTVQAAQDASVTLGSGAGALTVKNSTNTFDGLVSGVTIQLQAADPSKTLNITVANDTDSAKTAITDFVTAYNAVQTEINTDTSYDSSNQTPGILLGDSRVTSIQEQLRSIVGNIVKGVGASANRLTALGITTDTSGLLQVDSTRLQSALTGGDSGISLSDIRSLFATGGATSSAAFQFVSAGSNTKANAPYTIQVTQAAEQAALTGTSTLAGSIAIDGTNDQFQITLDGKSTTLTLSHGTYNPADLASTLQTAINGSSDLLGRSISVGVSNNKLTFRSAQYGAASQVAIGNGNANAALGLGGTEADNGVDVVGSFVVNGVVEKATGFGQFLLGASGNANTDGLQVRVTLTPDQVTAGTTGTVTVSRGIASQLDAQLDVLLDPVNGTLKNIDNAFNSQVADLEDRKTKQNALLTDQVQRLQSQFTQMEQTLSQLQSSTGFLLQQSNALSSQKSSTSSSSSSSGS